jgi:tetratricopeptide (TPR) repeat protein
MKIQYFISYSSIDGGDHVTYINEKLSESLPDVKLWWDRENKRMQNTSDWEYELDDGIKNSEGFIYVITTDSAKQTSVCSNETQRAMDYKKPIIPLKMEYDLTVPLRLNKMQYVDFSNGLDAGIEVLIERIKYSRTPDGKLQQMEVRLKHALSELERARPGTNMRERLEEEIERLNKQIVEQKRIVENPEAIKREATEAIKENIKKEREKKVEVTPVKTDDAITIVNAPPMVPPKYFQARKSELEDINTFLDNATHRILMIAGSGGMGKTTLVCKALSDQKALEKNKISAIIYLSHNGSNKITLNNILNGLKKLLPDTIVTALNEFLKAPNLSVAQKLMEVLKHFEDKKVVFLFDNFETLMDESSEISDDDTAEILSALLEAPHHGVKTIITTKKIPLSIVRQQPGRQMHIQLQDGLDKTHSANLLRKMDESGKLGLNEASEELLEAAFLQTNGNPRALETIYAILSADINSTLESVLETTKRATDKAEANNEGQQGTTAEILADEAFNRLDKDSQRIMQALAIYEEPVTALAINYMLLPFDNGSDSTSTLEQLKAAQFIHEDEGIYTINSEYSDYAMSRLNEGEPITADDLENPPFTIKALCLLAAEYWKLVRPDEIDWFQPGGLYIQIQEISSRTRASDFFGAAIVTDLIFEYLMQFGEYGLIINLLTPIVDKLKGGDFNTIEMESYSHLGIAYKETNHYNEAIQYFDEAIALTGKDTDYLLTKYLEAKGDCLADVGKTSEGLQLYLDALKIDEEILKIIDDDKFLGMSRRLSKVGDTLLKIGIDTDISTSIDYYSWASEKAMTDIEHVFSMLGLAQVWVVLGDFEKALESYDNIIEFSQEMTRVNLKNEIYYRAGLAYLYTNNAQTALELFNNAFEFDYPPNTDNLHAARGIAALLLGDTEFAKHEFESTLEVVEMQLNFSDENYDGLFSKGHAIVGLAMMTDDNTDLLEQALGCYKRAIHINGDLGVFNLEANLFGCMNAIDKNNQFEAFGERLVNEFHKVHEVKDGGGSNPVAKQNGETLQLRNTYVENLLDDEVQQILEHYNFFENSRFKSGVGLESEYFVNETEELVKDTVTGLMWQQGGSEFPENLEKAIVYIDDLNATNYLGYNDWRLPTLEEALSLLTPARTNKRYMHPIFNKKVTPIWTGDFGEPGKAWQIDFVNAFCAPNKIKGFWSVSYVKAVRED